MKTIQLFTFIATIVLVSSSCERHGPKQITKPFKATFFTILKGFEEDKGGCVAPHNVLNTQEGNGTATYIGNFTTALTFCVDPTTFEYINAKGSFVAENGDEIFVAGKGQILPSTKAGYDLEFFDDIEITGGTGKFKLATGHLTTESYVNLTTQQTDHVWTGTITLFK